MNRLERERNRIIENCTRCGACAAVCPSIEIAGLNRLKNTEIQTELYRFISHPRKNEIASARMDSCLECFKCVDSCPQGLDPLLMIETAKALAAKNGIPPYGEADTDDLTPHRTSVAEDLTEEERESVLKVSGKRGNKYLFFPGCNVYKDARRLVRIRAILDRIGEETTFLPGLEHCCGDRHIFEGQFDKGEEAYRALSEEIEKYDPEVVILWCPTCLCRLKKTWKSPVRFISFFQFCLDHMDRLEFAPSRETRKVTLHEPCKTAYTGLDASHREILKRLPGVELTEMPGGTKCCGSGGISWYRDETVRAVTKKRLDEALETDAVSMVTVCHYCQELFEEEKGDRDLDIENLADLIFESLK